MSSEAERKDSTESGEPGADIEKLFDALRNSDIDPYAWSAVAVNRVGAKEAKLVGGLLRDSQARVVQGAQILLHLMGSAAEVVPLLLEGFLEYEEKCSEDGSADYDALFCYGANLAHAIARFGAEAVPWLLEKIGDENESAALSELPDIVSLAISGIGPEAVTPLFKAVEDHEDALEYVPELFIGLATEKNFEEITEDLIAALRHHSDRVRLAAVRALSYIRPKSAIDAIENAAARDNCDQVRNEASETAKTIRKKIEDGP
ncbi:MAG: HEAT repeat domain-containing protein [Sedimentisphaerales bacterium]|nr:HEAT repeat domain-containing protein [Sedimentisphaerales bacterium]